jgi:hypothetical protein
MHDRQWVRIGFAFVLASTGVLAVSVAGCGDDNGPGVGPGSDASNDMTMPQPDSSGMPDTGGGGDTSTPPGDSGEAGPTSNKHAQIFVVHASETAPPLRFCFAIPKNDAGAVTVVSSFFADPSTAAPGLPFPGVFPGTGGLLSDHGVDLSMLTIAAFGIDATKITMDTADGGPDGGAERNCAQLLGSDGLGSAGNGGGALTAGTDFWPLGVITAGTLAHGTSWVYAITGCPPGASSAHQPFCGAGYDATKGNLGFTAFQLDSTSTVASGKMGAQLVHASQAWDAVQTGLGASVFSAAAFYIEQLDGGTTPTDAGAPDVGADTAAADTGTVSDASGEGGADATISDAAVEAAADSGGGTEAGGGSDASTLPPTTNIPFAVPAPYGKVTPATMVPIGGLTFDGTSGVAMSYVNGTTPVGMPAAFPLPIVQELTYGSATGVPFANGSTFAFVLVGNPNQMLQPTYVTPAGMACAAPNPPACNFNGYSVHFLAFPAFNQ